MKNEFNKFLIATCSFLIGISLGEIISSSPHYAHYSSSQIQQMSAATKKNKALQEINKYLSTMKCSATLDDNIIKVKCNPTFEEYTKEQQYTLYKSISKGLTSIMVKYQLMNLSYQKNNINKANFYINDKEIVSIKIPTHSFLF